MTIRAAETADAPQIAEIWNHSIRETTVTFNPIEKTAEEVATLIAKDSFVWEEQGQVLGFARYFAFRGGEGYRFTSEHTVIVHPYQQGRGGGRALMQTVLSHAKAVGKRSMFAGFSAENPDAVRFHVKLGFQQVATLPEVGFKFGRWIDLVLMQKTL
jgi:L-amino acid N-acyltransferase YncA